MSFNPEQVDFSDCSQCKNCMQRLIESSRFCPICGQKVIENRLTTGGIIQEVAASFTNVESGFWYSMIVLVRKPHQYAIDAISGGTKKYTNVFRLMLLLSAVNLFLSSTTGVFGAQMAISSTENDSQFTANLIDKIQGYLLYFIFLLIPFFASASYIIFKSRKVNFAEHIILNTVWLSGTTLIGLFTYLLIPIFGVDNLMVFGSATMIIFLGYFVYGNKYFFGLSWFSAIFLSMLHLFVGYILISIFLFGTMTLIEWIGRLF